MDSRLSKEKEMEMEIMRIRSKRRLSHEEAARNGKIEEVRDNQSRRKHDEYSFSKDKIKFLAFLAMVIYCAAEAERKSERIEIVVDAARKFFDIEEITGENVQGLLREAFRPSQSLD